MSGFIAVVSLDRDPTRARHEAQGLAEAYAQLRGALTSVRAADECTAHAFAAGADVDVTLAGDGWTMIHGRAYGKVRRPVAPSNVTTLDGQVCLVSHDPTNGRTVIATDRLGAAPVYVAERPGLLYVSTSSMAIARHLHAPADPNALRNFLVSGYQFGAETHWDGVCRLEPGFLLEVRNDRVEQQRYWQPSVDRAIESLGLDEVTDRLLDVSVETYRARLSGRPTWIDLTGGYDSRLMALLLTEAGVPFTGNTRDSTVTPDITLSGEIAAVTGWPWEPMLLPNDWPARIPTAAQQALAAADGRLEVLELSRVLWWHQELAKKQSSLLSAGGGEHLQYYAWSTELPFPGRKNVNLARWVDMIALKPNDLAVLAPGSRAATRTAYIDRLEQWIKPFADEPSTRQLDLCYAYKCGGHFGAYRAADDVVIDAQLPYYFEPVFSAAFSVHDRHRGGFRLMRQMMHRLDPAVAAIETTRGGPALPMRARTLNRYLPYYGVLMRKGLNKVTGQLGGQPPFPLQKLSSRAPQDAHVAVVEDLQRRGTLDWDRLRVRPLLSADGVRRLRTGGAGTSMLGRVLTAEMALAATDASL